MSVTRQTTVWCDSCGWWHQESGNAVQVRRAARRLGWLIQRGQDLCPVCVRETPSRVPKEG